MVTREQNELLTRVEGDAPMGKMMRDHYWIPAAMSSQVTEDGVPLRVRLLGEDFVAFRATDGRVGFLDERCPHRGTSLALARNEACGLRCIFHGWKIDVSGKVVDVPTHSPNPEAFAAKVKVGHYPVHEGGGIVWVWLGATEAPPFPELPFTILPENQVWMTLTKCYCNWLQGVEATLDSAHVGTLHMAYVNRDQANQPMVLALDALAPRYEVDHTAYGLDAVALRPVRDGGTYVRTTKYIMPFISFTPGGHEVPAVIFIVSPIDDTHHNLFYGAWSHHAGFNDGSGIPEEMLSVAGDLPYDPHNFGGFTSDRDHNFGQDRQAMHDGHFSGFVGNLLQEDTVTQASMGPIVDRTKDHLSSSDVAIIHAQRMLLEGLADVAAGRLPRGAQAGMDHRDVVPVNMLKPAEPDRSDLAVDYYAAAQ